MIVLVAAVNLAPIVHAQTDHYRLGGLSKQGLQVESDVLFYPSPFGGTVEVEDARVTTVRLVIFDSKDEVLFDSQPVAGTTVGGAESGDATLFIPDSGVTNSMLANGAVTSDKLSSEAAVKSLNELTGDVSLLAGTNINITSSGNDLTISATGGNGGGEQGPSGPQGDKGDQGDQGDQGPQEKPLRYCPYGRLLTTRVQISSVGTKTTAWALESLVPLSEEVESAVRFPAN